MMITLKSEVIHYLKPTADDGDGDDGDVYLCPGFGASPVRSHRANLAAAGCSLVRACLLGSPGAAEDDVARILLPDFGPETVRDLADFVSGRRDRLEGADVQQLLRALGFFGRHSGREEKAQANEAEEAEEKHYDISTKLETNFWEEDDYYRDDDFHGGAFHDDDSGGYYAQDDAVECEAYEEGAEEDAKVERKVEMISAGRKRKRRRLFKVDRARDGWLLRRHRIDRHPVVALRDVGVVGKFPSVGEKRQEADPWLPTNDDRDDDQELTQVRKRPTGRPRGRPRKRQIKQETAYSLDQDVAPSKRTRRDYIPRKGRRRPSVASPPENVGELPFPASPVDSIQDGGNGGGALTCRRCPAGGGGGVFADVVELRRHARSHGLEFQTCDRTGLFRCPREGCEYEHPEAESVVAHLRWKHGHRLCPNCGKYLPDDRRFTDHVCRHHSDCHSECYVCHDVFADSQSKNRHVEQAHPGEDFVPMEKTLAGEEVCPRPDCDFSHADRFELASHHSAAHDDPVCPFCFKSTSFDSLRRDHTTKVHPTMSFQVCSPCQMVFKDEASLLAHKAAGHPGSVKVLCHTCGEDVPKGTMPRHSKYCKGDKFPQISRLNSFLGVKQVKMSLGEDKLFHCGEAGCGFSHPSKDKVRKHFNSKHNRLQCPHCPMMFNVNNIFLHIAVKHTGETRVQCEQCPQRFYTRTLLREHVEEVHDTQVFVCEVCGQAFNSSRARIQHKSEKHRRERKYPCPFCGRVFRSRTLIVPHVASEHPGREEEAAAIIEAEAAAQRAELGAARSRNYKLKKARANLGANSSQ